MLVYTVGYSVNSWGSLGCSLGSVGCISASSVNSLGFVDYSLASLGYSWGWLGCNLDW